MLESLSVWTVWTQEITVAVISCAATDKGDTGRKDGSEQEASGKDQKDNWEKTKKTIQDY